MERQSRGRSLGRNHPSRDQRIHRLRRVESRSGARSVEVCRSTEAGVCVEYYNSELQRELPSQQTAGSN